MQYGIHNIFRQSFWVLGKGLVALKFGLPVPCWHSKRSKAKGEIFCTNPQK
jgi:hypothetical protein